MFKIVIKYKIQVIRTIDVAICLEKWRQTRVQALSEVAKYKFQFYQLWLHLVEFG